jgi:hypothetical protein
MKRRPQSGNAAWIEAGKKNLARGRLRATYPDREEMQRRGLLDSATNSKLRLAQIEHEVQMAKALEAEGFEVLSPTVVCDRIAVRDGKVYFVEFKRVGQKLRPGQQKIHDAVPEMYLIRYSP